MKITIVSLLILINSFSIVAQDPQLFEDSWYLEKLVIDGEDVFHPINSEIQFVDLIVTMSTIQTSACNDYGGSVLGITNDAITVDIIYQLPQNCFLLETNQFETIYLEDFWIWFQQGNSYDYDIQPGPNNSKVLTLSNENGNLAIYNNQLLSSIENPKKDIAVYPNPAKEEVFISGLTERMSYSLFTILGVQVSKGIVGNNEPITTGDLQSGIYILQLEDGRTGRVVIE